MNFVHANGRVGSLAYNWWWLICTIYNALSLGVAAFAASAGAIIAWRLIG